MINHKLIGFGLAAVLVLISLPCLLWAQEVSVTASAKLSTVYDDNLDFDQKDERSSFGVNAVPGLKLNYASELLQFNIISEVDVIKYFTETDFDRTNQFYGLDGSYQMSPRWKFSGNLSYRRDETIDSVLEETGQSFQRGRVDTYNGGAGAFYQLTELSDIGLAADYRKRDFSSDQDTDYDVYRINLPYTKHFASQRDILSLVPSYSDFNSDDSEEAKDYALEIGWEHQIDETLTSIMMAAGRYTDIDQQDGSSDSNWGYLAKLGLRKKTETFAGRIEASHDIHANSDAEIVQVNKLLLSANKLLTERFGLKFSGSAYYTDTLSKQAKDEKTIYFVLNPSLFYKLTENHSLELNYQYQNKKELDEPGNPVSQRNIVWLGLVLNFPKKWN